MDSEEEDWGYVVDDFEGGYNGSDVDNDFIGSEVFALNKTNREKGMNDLIEEWPEDPLPARGLPDIDLAASYELVYPTNYPLRDYQLDIVKQGLNVEMCICICQVFERMHENNEIH